MNGKAVGIGSDGPDPVQEARTWCKTQLMAIRLEVILRTEVKAGEQERGCGQGEGVDQKWRVFASEGTLDFPLLPARRNRYQTLYKLKVQALRRTSRAAPGFNIRCTS